MSVSQKILEDFIQTNKQSKKELQAYYQKNKEALIHFLDLEFSFLDSIKNLKIKNNIKSIMQLSDPRLFTRSMLKVDTYLKSPKARLNLYNNSELRARFAEILKIMPVYVKFLEIALTHDNKADVIRARHSEDDQPDLLAKEQELKESLEDAKKELAQEKMKVQRIEDKIELLKNKIEKTHSIILNKKDHEPRTDSKPIEHIKKDDLKESIKQTDAKTKPMQAPIKSLSTASNEEAKRAKSRAIPQKPEINRSGEDNTVDLIKPENQINIELFSDPDIGNASSTVTGAGVRALSKHFGLKAFEKSDKGSWRGNYNHFVLTLQKEGRYPQFIRFLKTAKVNGSPISKENRPKDGDLISFDIDEFDKNNWAKELLTEKKDAKKPAPKKIGLLKKDEPTKMTKPKEGSEAEIRSTELKKPVGLKKQKEDTKVKATPDELRKPKEWSEAEIDPEEQQTPQIKEDAHTDLKVDWDAMGEFLREEYQLEPNGMSKPEAKLARPALFGSNESILLEAIDLIPSAKIADDENLQDLLLYTARRAISINVYKKAMSILESINGYEKERLILVRNERQGAIKQMR